MRLFKILAHLLPAMALVCAGPARAFHEHGVANCDGCHTMHNSQDDMPANPDAPHGSEWLLLSGSITDLCLTCHATANGAVMGSNPIAPPPEKGAGNFTFLLEDNLNDGTNSLQSPIAGCQAGHNVVSATYGIPVDPENPVAPGGTYPSGYLTCTSCHDPHGNNNYRMLYGRGRTGTNGYYFNYSAPIGAGIALDSQEGRTNHAAYKSGWTEWCGNCHANNPHQGYMNFSHPLTGHIGSDQRNNYNGYDGPSNPTGGQYATAYIPELPIEDPNMTVSGTTGATSSSDISCLTCHRAHGTSAPKAVRWDSNVTRLSEDGVRSGSYPLPNPYSDSEQRALCIKCHYAQAKDHGMNQPCMSCHRQAK